MSNVIASFLLLPASQRTDAVQRWLSGEPDKALAAHALAEALAAMEPEPYTAVGSNASTALIYFLEAEGLRHVLDEAAEAATEPRLAAQLWAHASTSALILGELADLPYAYARRSVLADPGDAMAWEAYQNSLYSDTTGFFEDIEEWQRRAASGELSPEIAARALAAAERCAPDWSAEDREMLELLRG